MGALCALHTTACLPESSIYGRCCKACQAALSCWAGLGCACWRIPDPVVHRHLPGKPSDARAVFRTQGVDRAESRETKVQFGLADVSGNMEIGRSSVWAVKGFTELLGCREFSGSRDLQGSGLPPLVGRSGLPIIWKQSATRRAGGSRLCDRPGRSAGLRRCIRCLPSCQNRSRLSVRHRHLLKRFSFTLFSRPM